MLAVCIPPPFILCHYFSNLSKAREMAEWFRAHAFFRGLSQFLTPTVGGSQPKIILGPELLPLLGLCGHVHAQSHINTHTHKCKNN